MAPLAHFAALLPRYIFFRTGEPQAMVGKVFVSLLSPTAFTFSADLYGEYQAAGVCAAFGCISFSCYNKIFHQMKNRSAVSQQPVCSCKHTRSTGTKPYCAMPMILHVKMLSF